MQLGLDYLEVKTSALAEDTFLEDFTVSFALRLHREAQLDLWNITEANHWR